MRDLYQSIGLFVFSLILVVTIQLQNLPPEPTEEVRINRERDEIIVSYLFLKSDFLDQTILEDFLEKTLANSEEKPYLNDLLILLLGIEGKLEKAAPLLEKLSDLPKKQILAYSFGQSEIIPLNWEDVYPDGWVKAKLASLIYRRDNDDALYAESLVSIREYENLTHGFARINHAFQLMGLIGFIILIGMIFSRRYYRILGKPFFLLSPLYLPTSHFFRFSGLLLIGFILTGSLAQWLFGRLDQMAGMLTGYILFILLTYYLSKRTFFEHGQTKLLQTLQLDDLKMHFSYVWHIFKAVSVLVALYLSSLAISHTLGWPLDRFSLNSHYQNLLNQPISAALMFAMACILAPIFEEIVFRGMIQRALLGYGKPWVAILVSSLIFMIIHPMPQWPATLAVGLGLALVYQRSGNLLISIWTHAAWNGFMLILINLGIFP